MPPLEGSQVSPPSSLRQTPAGSWKPLAYMPSHTRPGFSALMKTFVTVWLTSAEPIVLPVGSPCVSRRQVFP